MENSDIAVGSTNRPNTRLREHNQKVMKRILTANEEYTSLAAAVGRISEKVLESRVDIRDEKTFPVLDESFSWKKVAQKFQEADSSTGFTQVLRAGVQNIVNAAYQQPLQVTYEDWVKMVASNKNEELYAPLHGLSFPSEVGRQEKYPEVRAAGLDIGLTNRKYGAVYSIEKELLMDDQTGQFQQQAGLMGEYMRYLLEALCYGKLASVNNMQYAEFLIPKSETQPEDEAVYPWAPAATPLVGGGITRPTAFGIISKDNFQAAKIGLMNQKNKLGLKMAVNGNRLLVGPRQSFDAATLMNSSFFPSVAGAAGSTGGNFAINPIKGLADISVTRFMFKNDGTVNGDSLAWYLVDQDKPWFVAQQREAVNVTQEDINSGDSFNRDTYRFKVSMRGNADFIDSRFAWQGNDGSASTI